MSQVDLLPNQDSLKPKPRILFLPYQVAESVLLSLDDLNLLFNFRRAWELLGGRSLDHLIYVNSLYNSGDSKFLKSELLPGFEVVDLLDVYRDQIALVAEADADLSSSYDDVVRGVESRKITKPDIASEYLRPPVSGVSDVEQYYVPKMLYLRDGIYGVRLVAVTDLLEEKQIIVANLELLSKTFQITDLASLPYFKHCIDIC